MLKSVKSTKKAMGGAGKKMAKKTMSKMEMMKEKMMGMGSSGIKKVKTAAKSVMKKAKKY